MGKRDNHSGWLDDFSLVLTRQAVQSYRRDPKFEPFAGSKPLSTAWLAVISGIAGAFGGMLISGALWSSWLQVPLWLIGFVVFCIVMRKATLAVSGQYLAFLTSWSSAWGLLIGVCSMWAAQRTGSGSTYGIAIGVGWLIGLIQGVYQPDDLEGPDAFFGISMLSAPLGASLAAWLYRNALPDPATLAAAALTGAVAGLVFLGPAMAFLFARLNNVDGLRRLASLLLHNEETAAEALPLLDSALRLAPKNADLIERRAFACTLLGRNQEAEADWTRHTEWEPKSLAREIAQGWVHLRRNRPAEAVASFERASASRKRDRRAALGLGIARLRGGDGPGAVAALETIAGQSHDALSLTYLAEAHLAAGNARQAEETASDAIDELDSIHGRTWLARGDARRAMGNLDGAAKDYNKALWADDELGIEERAMARLEEIGRPVTEDEPD